MYAAATLLLHFAALIAQGEAHNFSYYHNILKDGNLTYRNVEAQKYGYMGNQYKNRTIPQPTDEIFLRHGNLNEPRQGQIINRTEELIIYNGTLPGQHAVINQNMTVIHLPPGSAPYPYPIPPPYTLPPPSTINHLPTVTPNYQPTYYPTAQYPWYPTQNPWYPYRYPSYPAQNPWYLTQNKWYQNGYPWYPKGYSWYSKTYPWYQKRYQ